MYTRICWKEEDWAIAVTAGIAYLKANPGATQEWIFENAINVLPEEKQRTISKEAVRGLIHRMREKLRVKPDPAVVLRTRGQRWTVQPAPAPAVKPLPADIQHDVHIVGAASKPVTLTDLAAQLVNVKDSIADAVVKVQEENQSLKVQNGLLQEVVGAQTMKIQELEAKLKAMSVGDQLLEALQLYFETKPDLKPEPKPKADETEKTLRDALGGKTIVAEVIKPAEALNGAGKHHANVPASHRIKLAVVAHTGVVSWGLPSRFPEIEFHFVEKERFVTGKHDHVLALRGAGVSQHDISKLEERFGKEIVHGMDYGKSRVCTWLEARVANHLANSIRH